MFAPKDLSPYRRPHRTEGEPDVAEQTLEQPRASAEAAQESERTLELREEQLVAHTELRDLGEVEIRTEIDQVPGRLEVDAYREEAEIEHEPVGQVVSEREETREEDGVLVVPIYEEQLVVTKRLLLRERMHIRRVATTERHRFEDTLRRERLVVDDPQGTGAIREQDPTGELAAASSTTAPEETMAQAEEEPAEERQQGGFLEHLVRKALE